MYLYIIYIYKQISLSPGNRVVVLYLIAFLLNLDQAALLQRNATYSTRISFSLVLKLKATTTSIWRDSCRDLGSSIFCAMHCSPLRGVGTFETNYRRPIRTCVFIGRRVIFESNFSREKRFRVIIARVVEGFEDKVLRTGHTRPITIV